MTGLVVRPVEEYGVDPFTLLAGSVQANLNGDTGEALRLVKLARSIATPEQVETVYLLSSSVMLDIAWVRHAKIPAKGNRHSEFAVVHYWFRNNYQAFIPTANLTKVVPRNKCIPDFMVLLDGKNYPVECKLSFTARSLNQLLEYMKVYGAEHGYAVALDLKCALPSNITFIECPVDATHRAVRS